VRWDPQKSQSATAVKKLNNFIPYIFQHLQNQSSISGQAANSRIIFYRSREQTKNSGLNAADNLKRFPCFF
jgi:hypothetical protein